MAQTHWILLRGLTRESGHWGPFLTQFGQAIPNRQVIALDLPGNGELNQLRSPLRVSDMVANCRAQLLARGVAPPYALLTMSLGAMVALDWAQAQPVEVTAQVLINTSMRPLHAFYQRLQPANYGTLLKLMLPGTSAESWEQAILRMTSHHAPAGTLAHWLVLRQAHPVSRKIAAARFCAPPAPPLPHLVAGQQSGSTGQRGVFQRPGAKLAMRPATAPQRRARFAPGRCALGD